MLTHEIRRTVLIDWYGSFTMAKKIKVLERGAVF